MWFPNVLSVPLLPHAFCHASQILEANGMPILRCRSLGVRGGLSGRFHTLQAIRCIRRKATSFEHIRQHRNVGRRHEHGPSEHRQHRLSAGHHLLQYTGQVHTAVTSDELQRVSQCVSAEPSDCGSAFFYASMEAVRPFWARAPIPPRVLIPKFWPN
jgi:hypothetical protein